MDRSLDEIISERPDRPRGGGRGRGGRGGGGGDRRAPPPRTARREEYPRDGVRKYRRDEPTNLDSYDCNYHDMGERHELTYRSDWVHDRFEGERYDRSQRHAPIEDDRYAPRNAAPSGGSKIRVDNIHYELTENDLRELFERIGPVVSVRLLYDRADRSQGTAFVVYEDPRDASDAVRQFDGQNANGQAIRMTLLPAGPAPSAPRGSLFDRIEKPPRSLFDRIDNGADPRDNRRRRERSGSPRNGGGGRAAADVDRYVPGGGRGGSRSPIRRRGTPREGGRRPGARREESGRGGRGGRRPRTDDQGHELVGGRPRKTAEELDAEMADYWGSKGAEGNGETTAATTTGAAANGTNGAVGDVDMDI